MIARIHDDRLAWREQLLHWARLLVLAALVTAGLITLIGNRSDTLRTFGLAMIALTGLTLTLTHPTRSYRLRSWTLITTVFGVSLTAHWLVGLNPGPVLADVFCLLLAGLLIGRGAMIGMLGLLAAVTFGLAGAYQWGYWSGPMLAEINAVDPRIFFRLSLVTVFFWAGIAMTVLYVVRSVEALLELRADDLTRLEEEETQRRAAEQAQREAETIAHQSQKLEALGQLSAGVAHDFNNTLFVIQGWTELLDGDDRAETKRDAVAAIRQATDQASKLARQLLIFGRKDVRSPKPLQIDRIMQETCATLRRLLPASLALEIDVERDLVVDADETQLQQLLYNLVINARDASSVDGRISVRARSEETEDGSWVVVEVADQGAGMEAETQRRIFEPFFTTKESGKGTGLGLSTVFGIVQQSGGRIELHSEPGAGTTFTVRLPKAVRPDPTTEPSAADDRIGLGTAHILVVEDDPSVRNLIVLALNRQGYTTVEAADGDEALLAIQSDGPTFDLLCTDAVFPGASLARVIEAYEAVSSSRRILVCSGYVPEDLAIEGIEAGLYAFLAKPFETRQLIDRIQEVLGRGTPVTLIG